MTFDRAILILEMEQLIALDKICAIVAQASLYPQGHEHHEASRELIKDLRERCGDSVEETLRIVRDELVKGSKAAPE